MRKKLNGVQKSPCCTQRDLPKKGLDEFMDADTNQRMDRDIMTVQEVAQYLRLNDVTVYRLARKGEIPAIKIGGSWRFRKDLIDEWFKRATKETQL